MKRSSFQVKRGAHVRLSVGVKPDEQATDADAAEAARPLASTDSDEDLYLRRAAPFRVTLFDLGTRLQSVAVASDDYGGRALSATAAPEQHEDFANEYVEIAWKGRASSIYATPRGFNSYVTHLYDYVLREDLEAFDRALLGSLIPHAADRMNPLASTAANGSARPLPNCLPLPLSKAGDALGAIEIFNESKSFEIDIDGELEKWKKREANEVDDAKEKWNSRSVETGAAFEPFALKPDREDLGDGDLHLRLKTSEEYEPFDTSDLTHFKVTAESFALAAEVPFKMTAQTPVRIFLRPRVFVLKSFHGSFNAVYQYGAAHASEEVGGDYYLITAGGRIPVYPKPAKDDALSSSERRRVMAVYQHRLALAAENPGFALAGYTPHFVDGVFTEWPYFYALTPFGTNIVSLVSAYNPGSALTLQGVTRSDIDTGGDGLSLGFDEGASILEDLPYIEPRTQYDSQLVAVINVKGKTFFVWRKIVVNLSADDVLGSPLEDAFNRTDFGWSGISTSAPVEP